MKFTFVLVLSVLITVSLGSIVKNYQYQDKIKLVSPLVAGISTDVPVTTDHGYTGSDYLGWQIFVNNYFHYRIKHPSEVSIKNGHNGDASLIKNKSIDIDISEGDLSTKDTINTIIEIDIDQKKTQLKNNYNLLNSISPIAIGSVTAQTYTSEENSQKIVYYYIPQENNKYLIVSNKSVDSNGDEYLTSEKIIYSLELTP